MEVTATEAKNRFGQMLDEARRAPAFIEKSGRRHGVQLSAAHDDDPNRHFEQHGVWNEEFRTW